MIYSRQREAVLNALRDAATHPTAEELYAALKPSYKEMSLATVYRNLNQLADAGTVKKLHMPAGPDRFDGNVQSHYHAVCSKCGHTVDIYTERMPDVCSVANEAEGSSGDISISDVIMLFTGVCKTCREGLNK